MSSSLRPVIGLLTASLVEPWAIRQWEGVAEAARDFDIDLVSYIGGVLKSVRFDEQANVLYDLVAAGRLDGLIVWSTAIGWYIKRTEFSEFLSRFDGTPVVSMEMRVPGVCSLAMDDYGGMRAVVDHLIEEHGRRRIAFIRGPRTHDGFEERYRAYRDSLEAHSFPLDENLVAFTTNELNGTEAMRAILREGHPVFDAVVGTNDMFAIEAMSVLSEQGLRIPDDVAVAGFDNMSESQATPVPLTSADPPFPAMGRRAIEIVIDLLEGKSAPEVEVMPIGLVKRRSCGCRHVGPPAVRSVPELSRDGLVEEVWALVAKSSREQGRAADEDLLRELWGLFAAEVLGDAGDGFLPALERATKHVVEAGADPSAWPRLLAAMQRASSPWTASLPYEARIRAGELWSGAFELTAEAIQGQMARKNVAFSMRYAALRSLSERLGSIHQVREQMDIISKQLERLGISGCYLSLCTDPGDLSGEARLILAHDDSGRIELPPEGLCFPAPELILRAARRGSRRRSLLTLALYFGPDTLGFAVFEIERKEDALICEVFRWQLSGALKGGAAIRAERAAAEEKAVLLKELQHRVKNSMGIISSIIGVEASEASQPETRHALASLESRMAAIGDLYEELFDSGDISSVDLSAYLRRVVESSVASIGEGGGRIALDLSLESHELDLKRAVSLGLIVNELVTDSLKHAFPGGRTGTIGLRLSLEGKALVLEIRDDGVGFPIGFDPESSKGFGLRMVGLLAEQIGMKLEFLPGGPGARTRLSLDASCLSPPLLPAR